MNNKSTVVGDLIIIPNFPMPEFNDGRTRTIRIWTPPKYKENPNIRYPVIYMHDGQNLFDDLTSFAGEWGVDETLMEMYERKENEGVIVVGIDNSERRMSEYMPHWNDDYEAEGEAYGEFIIETLKPYIDLNFLTKSDKQHTMIAGSSTGGLISFYIGLRYPQTFGMIGAFSPSFWISEKKKRQAFITRLKGVKELPRLYLDSGDLERHYLDLHPVASELISVGYPRKNIHIIIGSNDEHNETAWRKRFPSAIKWLYSSKRGNYS